MTDPHDLLELAHNIALEAGDLVRDGRRGLVEVADTKSSPTDVVTDVDLASERLIRRRIGDARPDDGFVGEEGDEVTGSSAVTWIVDPIDGTVNFLYDLPQYAVSIAAQVGDEVAAGVVHNPANGETYTALRGEGAWRNGAPIQSSSCTDLSLALVGTGYHYRADVRAHQAQEMARLVPKVRDVRRLGAAALDLCALGCGRLDAYVERGLNPWDRAAGALVAEEAGARVTGLQGDPAGKRVVVGATQSLFDAFHDALVEVGFAAWPMPEWP